MRGFATGMGLLLLVSAMPCCLLYTDRINRAPVATIHPPDTLFPGSMARFWATISDPYGDAVTSFWLRVDRRCGDTVPDDWKAAMTTYGDSVVVPPVTHDPFCLHLVVRDGDGAETVVPIEGNPVNRPPEVNVAVVEPPAMERYPLYTSFQITARCSDLDGDTVTTRWQVKDGTGADIALTDCPQGGPPGTTACFSADHPGTVVATAIASDGRDENRSPVSFSIGEDEPPCIEAADPELDTPAVVLAVTDPPRRFEVRQVRDDGNPFPGAGRGVASFRWYTAAETGPWRRELGYDRATFEVGAGSFEDARPGSVYRVRVEVRDPAHDTPSALRELEPCGDQRVCELPPRCVRWVGWKVQLQ